MSAVKSCAVVKSVLLLYRVLLCKVYFVLLRKVLCIALRRIKYVIKCALHLSLQTVTYLAKSWEWAVGKTKVRAR